MSAATAAAIVSIVSVPASIIGNEMALRLGRRAWIVCIMAITSVVGIIMAFSSAWGLWWIVFLLVAMHSMLIMADSATLTAGLVASADPKIKGADEKKLKDAIAEFAATFA